MLTITAIKIVKEKGMWKQPVLNQINSFQISLTYSLRHRTSAARSDHQRERERGPLNTFSYPFILSFYNYVMNTCYVTDPVLSTGNIIPNNFGSSRLHQCHQTHLNGYAFQSV
jgi:hypothetical protein